jgi:hypothetical protein
VCGAVVVGYRVRVAAVGALFGGSFNVGNPVRLAVVGNWVDTFVGLLLVGALDIGIPVGQGIGGLDERLVAGTLWEGQGSFKLRLATTKDEAASSRSTRAILSFSASLLCETAAEALLYLDDSKRARETINNFFMVTQKVKLRIKRKISEQAIVSQTYYGIARCMCVIRARAKKSRFSWQCSATPHRIAVVS